MTPRRRLRYAVALCALASAGAFAQAARNPGASGATGGLVPPIPGSTAPSVPPGAAVAPGGVVSPDTGTQPTPGQTAAQPGSGSRFVENCQQALDRGEVAAGCQGPLYASEIARLKDEALRSNNPALLTLLGDAYQGNRSAVSDIGQAYRWYLLTAVRGDPRAMQRLSELYKSGNGAPQDRVRALGYARLAQRLAIPGTRTATDAAQASATLGSNMANDEVAMADRFAADLEGSLRRQGVPVAEPGNKPADSAPPDAGWQGGITLRDRTSAPASGPAIPGMSGASQTAPR